MASVADGEILQTAVHDQIDQRRRRENRIGNEIAAEPVEHRTDCRADNDDRQADLRIEILARVEVAAATYRATINRAIFDEHRREFERDLASAAAALDRGRLVARAHREAGVARRTFRNDLQ